MSLLTIMATALPLIAAIAVAWFTLQNISRLTPIESPRHRLEGPLFFTVEELGRIEGTLPNLVRVLVVANKIEKPEGELGRAVESNFSRGVRYLFLISSSKAASEKLGYYKLFEAYAEIRGSAKDTLDIKALPFEWDDYPIIFYQTRDDTGVLASIAFRGTELLEGIANYYERVPAAYAHTIATSLLADAPADVNVSEIPGRSEFDNGTALNVVRIDTATRSAQSKTSIRN